MGKKSSNRTGAPARPGKPEPRSARTPASRSAKGAPGRRGDRPAPARSRANDGAAEGGEPGLAIVGIGASAGGLEALDAFLRHLPDKPGLAFVVVQHLDPTHKGIMVELLQRATPLPVVQVRDRLKVERDHVYVIPPNKDLSILQEEHGLSPHRAPHGPAPDR